MKRGRRRIAECLLILGCSLALGCDDPVASDRVTLTPQMVVTATDRLPDLGMARLSDLSIDKGPDKRRLLRYSTTIVNVGSAPFELHGQRGSSGETEMAVVQRIYDDAGSWSDVSTPAVMEFGGDGHDHWHVHDLQLSELFSLDNGDDVGRSEKRGFCFWDNVEYRLDMPGAPSSEVYEEDGCGDAESLELAMGLSIGWGDIYEADLPDQYVDITALPAGRYRLVVTADPFGWFAESDDSNNVTWVDFEIRSKGRRLKVLGYGPEAVASAGTSGGG